MGIEKELDALMDTRISTIKLITSMAKLELTDNQKHQNR